MIGRYKTFKGRPLKVLYRQTDIATFTPVSLIQACLQVGHYQISLKSGSGNGANLYLAKPLTGTTILNLSIVEVRQMKIGAPK